MMEKLYSENEQKIQGSKYEKAHVRSLR